MGWICKIHMDQVSPLHSHLSATLLACELKTRQKLSTKEPAADECLGDITNENEASCLYSFLVKYAISYLPQVAGEEPLAPRIKTSFILLSIQERDCFLSKLYSYLLLQKGWLLV